MSHKTSFCIFENYSWIRLVCNSSPEQIYDVIYSNACTVPLYSQRSEPSSLHWRRYFTALRGTRNGACVRGSNCKSTDCGRQFLTDDHVNLSKNSIAPGQGMQLLRNAPDSSWDKKVSYQVTLKQEMQWKWSSCYLEPSHLNLVLVKFRRKQ